jgi:hypothetical protein
MSNNKCVEAKKIVEGLNKNPSQALVIHYSRQNLMDNESGIATPRIIAIMVKSLDGKQNHCFAIHHEAEKADVILENITDYYDQLEERLLRSFNSFVKNNRDCKWIHWDMNDVHFGFEAIKHRYCVMVDEEGKDFQEIENHNRINLNTLLKDIYGASYEKEPQLENLMKTNNDGATKDGHLTIEEEAREFKNLGFPSILESLRCKVNFLLDVVDKTINGSLKVSSKYWLNKLRAFITHPVTATISILLTLLSIIFKIIGFFG